MPYPRNPYRLFISILILILLVPHFITAQELNQEAPHAFIHLEQNRFLELQLKPSPSGENVFETSFRYNTEWTDHQVFLNISGITAAFDIYINEFRFGSSKGDRMPVEFNISPLLQPEYNSVKIRFNSGEPDLPDLSCSEVLLHVRDPLHVRDIQITSYTDEEKNSSLVRAHLWVKSYLTERNRGRTVYLTIITPSGESIGPLSKTLKFPLAFRQEIEMEFEKTIKNAERWSPSSPSLYTAEIEVVESGFTDGEVIRSSFGLGDIMLADSLFIVGGDTLVPVVASSEITDQLCSKSEENILDLFRTGNYNVFRSEQAVSYSLLDLFDREGILLWRQESPNTGKTFRSEINHPCVFRQELE